MQPANAQRAAARISKKPLPRKTECDCALRFEVRLARPSDYRPFKRVLDVGRHPAFIGKDTMMKNARNGGALFYDLDGEPVAVSLINPHYGILLALNVLPSHRSHGLGTAIVKFLVPNFVRAIESKAPYFERLGYRRIGALKRGISLNTQLMARAALFKLAGRLAKAWRTVPARETRRQSRGRRKR